MYESGEPVKRHASGIEREEELKWWAMLIGEIDIQPIVASTPTRLGQPAQHFFASQAAFVLSTQIPALLGLLSSRVRRTTSLPIWMHKINLACIDPRQYILSMTGRL
jgi:hypothetical protein